MIISAISKRHFKHSYATYYYYARCSLVATALASFNIDNNLVWGVRHTNNNERDAHTALASAPPSRERASEQLRSHTTFEINTQHTSQFNSLTCHSNILAITYTLPILLSALIYRYLDPTAYLILWPCCAFSVVVVVVVGCALLIISHTHIATLRSVCV